MNKSFEFKGIYLKSEECFYESVDEFKESRVNEPLGKELKCLAFGQFKGQTFGIGISLMSDLVKYVPSTQIKEIVDSALESFLKNRGFINVNSGDGDK